MTLADGEQVVLLHGLWMNGLVMLPLARRLERCGFPVTRHGYRSVSRGLQEMRANLRSCATGKPGASIWSATASAGW